MRLTRFLITGILVPVVLGANDSKAEGCKGRFYVGMNFGAEFGKMKYDKNPGDQYDVVPDGVPTTDTRKERYANKGKGLPADRIVHILSKQPVSNKLPVFPKKKSSFIVDAEVGYIFEVKNFGIGLALNFGKRFATVKEKVSSKLLRYDTVPETKNRVIPYLNYDDMDAEQAPAGGIKTEEFVEEEFGRRAIEPEIYKKAIKYNTKDVTEIKLKNKYNVTITPIIEYKANSMFGVYVTGGIRISNDKVTYNEKDGATNKVTRFKKTKTSVAPVVGGGVLVNLTEHMYAKVQYLYQFGSKIKKTISRKLNDKKNVVNAQVKYRSQKITVGFGYMY